jgi:SAM-dependent methyltransferase
VAKEIDNWHREDENMLNEFDITYMGRSYAKIPLMKQFLEKWELTNKNHILDAGCGFGAWTWALAQLNKKTIGIEPRDDKAHIARSILDMTNRNGYVIEGDNEILCMSIEDMITKTNIGHFDGILCYHVIYYTESWQKTLDTLYGLLSPGGVMYINIATSECFVKMTEDRDPITRKMGNNALKQMINQRSGKSFDTKDGMPIIQRHFETELRKLGLQVKWQGLDEMANHPGVIGYLVTKT